MGAKVTERAAVKPIDPFQPILVCSFCGTAQYESDDHDGIYDNRPRFHCLVCGGAGVEYISPGTWLHAYTALRLQMEAPLTAAMLMLRREREGTPILLKDATLVAAGGSRFTVMRARKMIETQYYSMNRLRNTGGERPKKGPEEP